LDDSSNQTSNEDSGGIQTKSPVSADGEAGGSDHGMDDADSD